MSSRDYSIVEYYAEHERYRCGYCKSIDTNYSHGMWAHNMTVQDYQDLIDRGWRRSGRYCYKPTMHVTCCPMYTIKCAALDFKLTKSQKKVLKRFHRYLTYDETRNPDGSIGEDSETSEGPGDGSEMMDIPDLHEKSVRAEKNSENATLSSVDPSLTMTIGNIISSLTDTLPAAGQILSGTGELFSGAGQYLPSPGQLLSGTGQLLSAPGELLSGTGQLLSAPRQLLSGTAQLLSAPGHLLSGTSQFLSGVMDSSTNEVPDTETNLNSNSSVSCNEPKKFVTPGKGCDASKPPCKKAKLVRLERKKEKLLKKGFKEKEVEKLIAGNKKPAPTAKSLEEFLNEALPETSAHKLEIRLVRSSPPSVEFERTSEQAHEVYQKYQFAIHGEPPEKCTFRQYTRFLVSSPLQSCNPADGPPQGYGSFHQQYWLDGRLIAVGVIDILPRCISSVYFYYDPEMGQLSLGTYASLQELSLVRTLHQHAPALEYYYMGFYIHTCPKMRYKAAYTPSYLLCPETYTWHPVAECKRKLDQNRYCRFEEDISVIDVDGEVVVNEILVLYRSRAMPYSIFRAICRDSSDVIETVQYAQLVGMKCARRMLVVKN